MFDVITVGSATRDVFLWSKAFKVLKSKEFSTGKGISFSLGSKINLEELNFRAGGGAVNTAVTFANQGFKVAALASVGQDIRGAEIDRVLKERGVSTEFLYYDPHELTAYSIILSVKRGGRTIFRYSGAVWHLHEYKIPWNKMKAKWIYLNHIGDKSAFLLPKLIAFAKKNKIKIFMNPGITQIERREKIIPLLKDVDVFQVNQEEAALMTKIPYQKREEIFKVLDKWVKGVVVMTRGPKGLEVSDGKYRWSAGILPTKSAVDRTGAGDAFGSGFVSALIKKPQDIEYAIQLASANATGTLSKWGAIHGLLEKGESPYKFGKLKIKKTPL